MQDSANSVEEFLTNLPEERKGPIVRLFTTISENLPEGFHVEMSGGMIAWNVSLDIYPAGYHTKPNTPLPFINLASQKGFIALYHMGIYADKELLDWFITEYSRHSERKLDMGKSCIRFKKAEEIPYELIAELAQKMSPAEWITLYEKLYKK